MRFKDIDLRDPGAIVKHLKASLRMSSRGAYNSFVKVRLLHLR